MICAGLVVLLLGLGFGYERMAEQRDASRYPTEGRLVDVGGRRLHMLCMGKGPAPTVIMAGGSGTALDFYRVAQAGIAGFARVCAYDRAGSGWSDPVSTPRTLAEMATELDVLLARANMPGPYVLVGHSFGGLVVLEFARRYRRKSAGLVLVDSAEPVLTYQFFVEEGGLRTADETNERNELLARFGILRVAVTRGWGAPKGLPPEVIAEIANPKVYRANRLDGHADYDLNHDTFSPHMFGEMPMVVIRHGRPSFTGSQAALEIGWEQAQERLAALSNNSDVVVARNSSHMVNFDEPQVIVDAARRVVLAVRGASAIGTSSSSRLPRGGRRS